MTNPINSVREGMHVFDKAGHKIGHVDQVQMSDEDTETANVEVVANEHAEDGRNTFAEALLEAFRIDDVPEELHEQLLREGFIRLDADGLFAADRYILPEQIASVSNDEVRLKVTKDELIKS